MPNAPAHPTDIPYRELAPPPPLAGAVACVWTRGDGPEAAERKQTVVPDNCADIIWRLSPAGDVLNAFVAGPMSRPFALRGASSGYFVGVRFNPGQIAGVLRVNAGAVRDRHIPVEDVIPGLRTLLDGIEPTAIDATLAALGMALGGRIERARRLPPALAQALYQIDASQGQLGVESLARSVGASRQHLARLFDAHVGLRPKFVARVARLQRAMAIALRSRQVATARLPHNLAILSWSALAAHVGYADQSHMVADFVSLTGESPAAWLAAR